MSAIAGRVLRFMSEISPTWRYLNASKLRAFWKQILIQLTVRINKLYCWIWRSRLNHNLCLELRALSLLYSHQSDRRKLIPPSYLVVFKILHYPTSRKRFSSEKYQRTNFKLSTLLVNRSVKILITLRDRTLMLAFTDIPDCSGIFRSFINKD